MAERDQALAENRCLRALLKTRARAEDETSADLELLTDAAQRALEFIAGPNPFSDPARLRVQVLNRLEDALEVNGSRAVQLVIKSDAN
jgi:hypothetical protein